MVFVYVNFFSFILCFLTQLSLVYPYNDFYSTRISCPERHFVDQMDCGFNLRAFALRMEPYFDPLFAFVPMAMNCAKQNKIWFSCCVIGYHWFRQSDRQNFCAETSSSNSYTSFPDDWQSSDSKIAVIDIFPASKNENMKNTQKTQHLHTLIWMSLQLKKWSKESNNLENSPKNCSRKSSYRILCIFQSLFRSNVSLWPFIDIVRQIWCPLCIEFGVFSQFQLHHNLGTAQLELFQANGNR